MIFWDTSAILPLLVAEPRSPTVLALLQDRPGMVVWWGTRVEACSAIARRERHGGLTAAHASAARAFLTDLTAEWDEILPIEDVRDAASRLLRVHPLRAADALQLGAALVWADRRPTGRPFVTLDERLADAARREGFDLLLEVD